MDDTPPQAPAPAQRLPTSPYPGLRPFLDHEDMLMHGRQSQIEDVVERLGRHRRRPAGEAAPAADDDAAPVTRFVAVIGGSGSGKSSLIRAGVVPYLRQFGIPEAGDLWETVVATPGTNFQPDADGQVRESPITRLARKFERVLRGEHRAERCEALEQTLRRPGGLGLMIELFGSELNMPAGVRPEDACVLVVIDQFEELFHKTNVGSDDARLLIERVIDHYHQAKHGKGNPKCYLAITMRSEHLNDCAGYLGLPEAINAGSYLVSRLDDTQVREVIEKPAQRYLRLRQRERQSLARRLPAEAIAKLPPLPRAVVFEDGVVERLITDTRAIANDPDHLPLLQHVLARVWEAACTRRQLSTSDVPDAIALADLWRAAQAAGEAPLPPEQNVLQLSLNHWAEHTLDSHTAEERKTVLALMGRLAYKDSRTGTYNQQRLYVASHPLGPVRLRAMLEGRWIESVDYLFWDREDKARVTLKVSHESFIRGWKRLRDLADQEAWRLEQYIALLLATQRWVLKQRDDDDLLDARLLGLLTDARIEDAIGPRDAAHDADPETATWHDWHGWLVQLPQGQALTDVQRADVRSFFRQSHAALKATQSRGRRNVLIISALSVVALVTLLSSAFSFLVQQPVTERSQLFFQAANQANQVSLRNAYPQIGGSQHELETLLEAAAKLEWARSPRGARFAEISDAVLQGEWSPLKGLRLAYLLGEAARAVEPPVNGKLRALLTRSIWRTPNALPSDPNQLIDAAGSEPMFNVACGGISGNLKPVEGSRSGDAIKRGVFVSSGRLEAGRTAADSRNNLMYTATAEFDPTGELEHCSLGKQLQALPGEREPAVMFDSLLGYMFLAVNGDSNGAPATVSIQRVRWDDPETGGSAEIHQPLAVVYANQTADILRDQVRQGLGMTNATWRMAGGRAFQPSENIDEAWRVVADSVQRLVPQPPRDDLRPLQDEPGDRFCPLIKPVIEREARQAGSAAPDGSVGQTRVAVFRDGDYCLAILRIGLPNPSPVPGVPANPENARDQVNLRAYARPVARDLDDDGRLIAAPVAVASFEFGRVRPHDDQWFTGRPGTDAAGWLIIERKRSKRQGEPYFIGVPWSTNALLQLGAQVLKFHQATELAAGRSIAPPALAASPDAPPAAAPAAVAASPAALSASPAAAAASPAAAPAPPAATAASPAAAPVSPAPSAGG